MQKIVINLWFDTQAKEAADFYVSLFPNSKIEKINYYTDASSKVSGMPAGSVLTVAFTLDGQKYIAINGGPYFTFTPAISLMVNCDSQKEIDRLWNALIAGGNPSECGWLIDRYGLSWQIVPTDLEKLLNGPDPVKSQQVQKLFYTMSKIEIAPLLEAYNASS